MDGNNSSKGKREKRRNRKDRSSGERSETHRRGVKTEALKALALIGLGILAGFVFAKVFHIHIFIGEIPQQAAAISNPQLEGILTQ